MPLVEYSDSEDSDASTNKKTKIEAKSPQGAKRNRSPSSSALPPLPSNFHDLYASTARVSNQDDPDLHGGRQRQTPHVEGNWPTHVYVEWFPSTEQAEELDTLISQFDAARDRDGGSEVKLHSHLKSELGTPQPLHISLSAPIVLRLHQRQLYLNSLLARIRKAGLQSFTVQPSGLDWVANQDKTRWFLVLQLKQTANGRMWKLSNASNETAKEFGQPSLYPENVAGPEGRASEISAPFHISLAWSLKEPSELKSCSESFKVPAFDVPVPSIKVKIGNTIETVELSSVFEASNEYLFG